MDEDYTRVMKSSEFADIDKNTDGYFVLVTRDTLSNILLEEEGPTSLDV